MIFDLNEKLKRKFKIYISKKIYIHKKIYKSKLKNAAT